jgi:hypothetical protein
MLLEDEEISSLVDNRVYPIIAPEGTKGDYIVYIRDEYSISRTKQGIYDQKCIVYVSCVSSSYDNSQKLASAVFNCLDGRYSKSENTIINNIQMIDSTEDYAGDVYIQVLEFSIQ